MRLDFNLPIGTVPELDFLNCLFFKKNRIPFNTHLKEI